MSSLTKRQNREALVCDFSRVGRDISSFFLSVQRLSCHQATLDITANMSTLADELLQDFEDSGSEGADQGYDLIEEGPRINGGVSGNRRKANYTDHDGEMMLDGDEEAMDTGDEGTNGVKTTAEALSDDDDEEAAKAKVEKMQLGGVTDVRSVAGLMETLEPVLEVSLHRSLRYG